MYCISDHQQMWLIWSNLNMSSVCFECPLSVWQSLCLIKGALLWFRFHKTNYRRETNMTKNGPDRCSRGRDRDILTFRPFSMGPNNLIVSLYYTHPSFSNSTPAVCRGKHMNQMNLHAHDGSYMWASLPSALVSVGPVIIIYFIWRVIYSDWQRGYHQSRFYAPSLAALICCCVQSAGPSSTMDQLHETNWSIILYYSYCIAYFLFSETHFSI